MRTVFHTFGCKANQYDTQRMRQELEARGAQTVSRPADADVCVVNTCTVTSRADAEARAFVRRMRRDHPEVRIVVAGCSAALRGADFERLTGVAAVVSGHDPVAIAEASERTLRPLVQLALPRSLHLIDREPVGGTLLLRHEGGVRGWLKIQDGCDRKCSFCATRLARGPSRSGSPGELVREAKGLSRFHPELVLTGIHIGHYGLDLDPPLPLSGLLARLLDEVPDVRFRLGSIEATEVDELLLELLVTSGGRLVPHLHMPLQSGSDPVLRRMRRWHTRDTYRARTLELAERLGVGSGGVLGLGADIITGFPGETDEDHAQTVALVEELPYTYLHVFPFSEREGTAAAELQREMPVPQRVAGERSKELRALVQAKEAAYRRRRVGTQAHIVLEGEGGSALM